VAGEADREADLNGRNLKLDGPTLAGVYSGKIQSWDDPAIAAINTGVKLPHNAIVPIHRSDVSGDTFIFTQYLTFTTPSWEYSPGYGTTIAWAATPNALTADGNAGMIAKIGAVMTAFLFPVMLDTIGTQILLYGLIVTSVLGAAVTWFFRIETTGVNLDSLNTKVPADVALAGMAAEAPLRRVSR
jgi:hypothetical protein